VYELIELPLEDLGRYSDLAENNYWSDRRLTVWREPNFLLTRLRTKAGYKLLGIRSRVERKIIGLAIVHSDEGTVSLLEVLPPTLILERELWLDLIRFAVQAGAKSLNAQLYLNDSLQAAAARMLQKRMPTLAVRTSVSFSALAIDPRLTFAYDVNAWAGTTMLMMGF